MANTANHYAPKRAVDVRKVGEIDALVTVSLVMAQLFTQRVALAGSPMQLPAVDTPAGFMLLAPSDNAGRIYFGGSEADQPGELAPGTSIRLASLGNTSAIWVDGAATDQVVIIAEK